MYLFMSAWCLSRECICTMEKPKGKRQKRIQKINSHTQSRRQRDRRVSETETPKKTTHKHILKHDILHSKFANSPCNWLRTVRNKGTVEFLSNQFNCLRLFMYWPLADTWAANISTSNSTPIASICFHFFPPLNSFRFAVSLCYVCRTFAFVVKLFGLQTHTRE